MPENIIVNERGAFGGDVEGPARTVVYCALGGTVAVGEVVSMDNVATLISAGTPPAVTSPAGVPKVKTTAATFLSTATMIGVALESGIAGETIAVCTNGVVEVLAGATVVAADKLTVDSSGRVVNTVPGAAGVITQIGISLESGSITVGNFVTAWVNFG